MGTAVAAASLDKLGAVLAHPRIRLGLGFVMVLCDLLTLQQTGRCLYLESHGVEQFGSKSIAVKCRAA